MSMSKTGERRGARGERQEASGELIEHQNCNAFCDRADSAKWLAAGAMLQGLKGLQGPKGTFQIEKHSVNKGVLVQED